MPMAAFDTISVAKRLEKDFDMPTKQAEGVAVVLHENFVGNVATKEDLKTLDDKLTDKIDMLEERLTEKIEAQGRELTGKITALDEKIEAQIGQVRGELKVEISQSVNRAIYTLGGLVGVLFIIDRLLPLFGVGN